MCGIGHLGTQNQNWFYQVVIIHDNKTDLPELTYFNVGDWTFHLTQKLTLSSIPNASN